VALDEALQQMHQACETIDEGALSSMLSRLVPEFQSTILHEVDE
jgi:hypothetical protein